MIINYGDCVSEWPWKEEQNQPLIAAVVWCVFSWQVCILSGWPKWRRRYFWSKFVTKFHMRMINVHVTGWCTASLRSLWHSAGCLRDRRLSYLVNNLLNEQLLTWETREYAARFSTSSPSWRGDKDARLPMLQVRGCLPLFSCRSHLHFLRPLHAYRTFLDCLSTSGHKMLLDFPSNSSWLPDTPASRLLIVSHICSLLTHLDDITCDKHRRPWTALPDNTGTSKLSRGAGDWSATPLLVWPLVCYSVLPAWKSSFFFSFFLGWLTSLHYMPVHACVWTHRQLYYMLLYRVLCARPFLGREEFS